MSRPPPLNYGPSGSSSPPKHPGMGRRVILGTLVGGLISGITWPWLLRSQASNLGMYILIGVPLLKVTTAACIIAFPRMRGFGIGLLISLPLGFLIFFGACAANFKV